MSNKLNPAQYKAIKKMSMQQLQNYLDSLRVDAFRAGVDSCGGKMFTANEVIEALLDVKGLGEKRTIQALDLIREKKRAKLKEKNIQTLCDFCYNLVLKDVKGVDEWLES